MKRNVCLQSTLRQPVRTLFLVLLLGLISFAFISRAVEYIVINRETERLARYYRAIGVLETESTGTYDVREGAALVAQSKYVAFEDRQRYSTGVLQGLYNADVDGFSSDLYYNIYKYRDYVQQKSGVHNSDIVVYGELLARAHVPYMSLTDEWFEYQFIMRVDEVVTGYPEYFQQGQYIRLRGIPERPEYVGELDDVYDAFIPGQRYLVRAYYNPTYNSSTGIGFRWESAYSHLIIKPLSEKGPWFLPVEPGAAVDLTDPALTQFREELQVLQTNQSAMVVISTKDMTAMPAMQESSRQYYLEEGRWLDREDDLLGRRVCVVHRDFAEKRGLALGDRITLELRQLKAPYFGYIVPGDDWGVWEDYETYTEEFEIVGLYSRFSAQTSQPTVYSTNMYIPDSCMPEVYESSRGGVYQGSYSFVLHSLQDVDAFLGENKEALAALGFRATFLDTGWGSFQAATRSMWRTTAANAAIFLLVLVLALLLAAFVYLRQRRRDFAILRLLGVPKCTAITQVLLPITSVGILGVLVGGSLSWHYALGKAGETLASLQGPQGVEPSVTLSFVWLCGLGAAVLTLLLSISGAGALLTARRPALDLIQDMLARTKKKKTRKHTVKDSSEQALEPAMSSMVLSLGEAPAGTRTYALSQAVRYMWRHISRAPIKSALTVALALFFTVALGWMNWTVERNKLEIDHLYRNVQVQAEVVKSNAALPVYRNGFIRSWVVDNIMRRGFVETAYLEAVGTAEQVVAQGGSGSRDYSRLAWGVPLQGFNQPEQFFLAKGQDISVEYAAGWDDTLFAQHWQRGNTCPVLLPSEMMERLDLILGEQIMIQGTRAYTASSCVIAGQYTGSIQDNDIPPILLAPSALNVLEESRALYTTAKFTMYPEKNRELAGLGAEINKMFYQMDVGVVSLTFVLWDQELTQAVEPLERNLSLMAVLYPVTMVVSVLIAMGLAALLMFQAAREAAIMRVLGNTKLRAQLTLCAEQLCLCSAGLLLGLALLIILRRDALAVIHSPALTCTGLYLAGAVCGCFSSAISVTNHMPLELLQVKE